MEPLPSKDKESQQNKPTPEDAGALVSMTSLDHERKAFVQLSPSGFRIRHPPPPNELHTYITPNSHLFQTSHMGIPLIKEPSYHLVVEGLVPRPFSVTLEQLKSLPATTITAFHECFGSPLKPPLENCLRIGNVEWTGVKLSYLLAHAGLAPSNINSEHFIWSEGLDRGTFAGVEADRYQKDLPMSKAMKSEVIVAYALNGEPLERERGGPVRLVVPGWFGTNSVKWLCKLSVRNSRAPGPYTTMFYNVVEPDSQRTRPVWEVNVNSMIVQPRSGEVIVGPSSLVWGWAWADDGVKNVHVMAEGDQDWREAVVDDRVDHGWQKFEIKLEMPVGRQTVVAKATSFGGAMQPLEGWRNHAHHVHVSRTE